jgi:hypothetical protein
VASESESIRIIFESILTTACPPLGLRFDDACARWWSTQPLSSTCRTWQFTHHRPGLVHHVTLAIPRSFAPPARGVVHMHSVYIYTQPINTPSPAISWHTMDLDVWISELSNSYSINTHVKWMYSYSIFDIFSIQFHICFW